MALFPFFVLFGIVLFFGVYLLVEARRGRRINDHPSCRKCGFDLYGATHREECPECGADLTAKRGVTDGMYQRRSGMRAAGWGLTLLAVAAIGARGYMYGREVGWQHFKPTWWLVSEAEGAPASISDESLEALADRIGDGELSPQQLDSLLDAALAFQTDNRWRTTWGNVVEAIHRRQPLTGERLKRYGQQAFTGVFLIDPRPKIRHGDPIPFRFHKAPTHTGRGDVLTPNMEWGQAKATLGDATGLLRIGGTISSSVSSYGNRLLRLSKEEWAKVKQGERELTLTVKFGLAADGDDTFNKDNQLWTGSVEVKQKVEVIDPSLHTIDVVDEASEQAKVEETVSVVALKVLEAVSYRKRAGDRWRMELDLTVANPPFDLACDVYIRARGGRGAGDGDKLTEWPVDAFKAIANETRKTKLYVRRQLKGFNADVVDIVLRPSRARGYETPDIKKMWNREIVIRGVKVQWEVAKK